MSLELLKELPYNGNARKGLYLCGCGRQKEIRIQNVKSGNTSSCGCETNRKSKTKNPQTGRGQVITPYEPVDLGKSSAPPLPVPSFDRVSQSRFERKPAGRYWEIWIDGKVFDRVPMAGSGF